MNRLLKTMLPALLLAGPALAQSLPADPAQRLPACLDMARAKPAEALAAARSWEESGGGIPARRCAAMAILHRGDPAAAAKRLAGLAAEMAEIRGPAQEVAALHAQAAQAWQMAGDPERAVQALGQAMALRPDDLDLRVDRAVAFALNRQYWEAVQELDAVLERDPKRLDAWLYRAGAHRLMGNNELALDDAERAVALKPTDPDALLERGNARRVTGDLAGAQADWRLVQKLDPDGPAGNAAKVNLERIAAGG
ncbi:MAG TPA: tetratricopeptide repeat protein [Alphaproteobacteria bacterium]|nr:tetratricopeptide repeat protein [Alphaproteobacteria bacterium]